MNINTTLTALAVCAGTFSMAPLSLAGQGSDTATAMTNYYNDTRPYCQNTSAPAFMCSGIILRATEPGPDYHSWSPSPASVISGGVSFSYLRADATFSELAWGHNNGMTFTPYNDAPSGAVKPEVLCSFPIDAAAEDRKSQGCGDSTRTPDIEDHCQALGITTAELWRNAYFAANQNNSRQCGFDIRDNSTIKSAQAFYESLRAMPMIKPLPALIDNELRLATWDQDTPLPVQSFFYTTDGLADAQKDQKDWFNTYGTYVPVISLTLPTAADTPAQFSYQEGDQVVCESYIQSGSWVKRFDNGINRDAWTLQVTPTQCGRQIQEDQTNAAYAELERKFSTAPQWNEEKGGGMRRQLVCHYVLARDKPVWNLEPFRPDVTHEQSIADGCNPVKEQGTSPTPIDLNKTGTAVVNDLTARYSNKANNCDTASSPAYLCSGIFLVRGHKPNGTEILSWDILNPPDTAAGAQASFLRTDAKFEYSATTMYAIPPFGFTLNLAQTPPPEYATLQVLCFVTDVNNPSRDQEGCGGHPSYKTQSYIYYYRRMASCQTQGVTTAEQWQSHTYNTLLNAWGSDYAGRAWNDRNNTTKWVYPCSFDVRTELGEGATNAFNEVVRFWNITPYYPYPNFARIYPRAGSNGKKPFVEAFYYLAPEGKPSAQASQRSYLQETGRSVPVVAIKLPVAQAEEAVFQYNPDGQAIP